MNKEQIKITLDGGVEVTVKKGSTGKRCECGAMIYFAKTKNGKTMPIHKAINKWVSHFTTCSLANKYRKQKKL